MKFTKKSILNAVLKSKIFKTFMKTAEDILKDKKTFAALLEEALKKAKSLKGKKKPIDELFGNLKVIFRLLTAYAKGEYKDISLKTIILLIASIIYFVSPVDVIPDFMIPWGYFDDATLLGWIISSMQEDFNKFRDWEKVKIATV